MKRWLVLPLVLSFVFALGVQPAQANDQEFVIGVGLGGHNFSDSDDFRQGSELFDGSDEIDSGVLFHLYAEWYLFDDIGLGVRNTAIAGGRTYSYLDAEQTDTASISALLLTVNWVPLGSEDYTRMGVMGGVGPATYTAEREVKFDSGEGNTSESETSTGMATLLGIYVDWGAEGFGARFGVNYLNTDLDPIEFDGEELEVDGTGYQWYFDLRWAFE